MIDLYGRETSGNTYKVRLLMAFLGIRYRQIEIHLGAGGRNQMDPSYLALNPRGQIPTLIDGQTTLWGSTSILVYLARRYDTSGTWLPCDDPATLGRIMQWLELAQNEVSTGLFRARAIARFGYAGDLDAARRDGELALGVLEKRLNAGDKWLATSNTPTVADIACFPYVALAPEGGLNLLAHQSIARWLSRMEDLPGFVALHK